APMLAAVVFIGRSVSGSAAELANMKIGEEIKALETLGVDVSRYLLLPMLGAFIVMLPVMDIYTVGVGLLGSQGGCSLAMGMQGVLIAAGLMNKLGVGRRTSRVWNES